MTVDVAVEMEMEVEVGTVGVVLAPPVGSEVLRVDDAVVSTVVGATVSGREVAVSAMSSPGCRPPRSSPRCAASTAPTNSRAHAAELAAMARRRRTVRTRPRTASSAVFVSG